MADLFIDYGGPGSVFKNDQTQGKICMFAIDNQCIIGYPYSYIYS